MPGNNGGFHSSFANNSVVGGGGTANYPQNGMWPGNQFQSAGQFGNSGGAGAGGGGGGGGHNQSQTNMSGFQCYNSANNGFQAMPPQQQQQQQWQHHPSGGSWSGQQWQQNQTRPNGAQGQGQGQGQGLPQMKNGDSYQRTCDYVQKCKAWTGQGGVGGDGSGGSA